MKYASLFALTALCTVANFAFAGGPLCFTAQGPAVRNTGATIKYKVDKGPLRPATPADPGIPSNVAKSMVADAFKIWSQLPTATIKFGEDGELSKDIDTGEEFIALENDPNSGNFVVFDQQGQIIDDLLGIGNRFSVLGFASPIQQGQQIVRFESLMNGLLAKSRASFLPTMIHEFGHAVGLDHAQIQAGLANDGDAVNDKFVPIMFPTSTDNEDLATPLNRDLHPDDAAWITKLYPSTTASQNYGSIRGKLLRTTGTAPLLGANVVAIAQNGSEQNRFSCVSDWLDTGSGEFVIPVPPGTYTLFVEPIRFGFDAGSSVGPHSESDEDLSFTQRAKPTQFSEVHTVTAGNNTSLITLKVEVVP